MGRCCAVSGCLSGRKTKKKSRKIALFKAPKDIEMFSKWSSALDMELKSTSYICELHFNPEDVLKSDQGVLKDGSVYVYEYEKIHLRKKAIPSLDPKKENNDKEHNYSLLKAGIRPKTNMTDDDDCSLNSDESLETETICEGMKIIKPKKHNVTNVNIPDDIDDVTNDGIDSDTELIINKPEEFTLCSIQKALEAQPIRQNWSWTLCVNSYISFSFVKRLELVCHVKIDKDFIVTIVNAKTNILIDMDVNISSVDCVWQLLSFLENSFFCHGTGFDDKKFSLTCTGILFPDDKYKKKVEHTRCLTCRRLRRLIQKRKNKKADYQARWINIKHRFILQRRKLYRALRQNQNLKQELLMLKNQCAEIEEEVLSEKIADLPALQQQTVRNCLFAAKAKNAKQRRYSTDWVNECFLMNIKSSALYEHIRKKNILPLPCKDTLMKYIQKM